MSLYLLDTNAWSVFVNGRSDAVRDRIASTRPADLVMSSVVWAELLYGWHAKDRPIRPGRQLWQLVDRYATLDFHASCADVYGPVRASLQSVGGPIGSNDFLIAATALAYDLILVTHNVGECSRVEGLRIEDWQMDTF